MGNNLRDNKTLQELVCRRRAHRFPLPLEVDLTLPDRSIPAMIRDASLPNGDNDDADFIGIGILHDVPLPLDEGLPCRLRSESNLIPEDSKVTLLWTRHFGRDGFLSGGRMLVEVDALKSTGAPYGATADHPVRPEFG